MGRYVMPDFRLSAFTCPICSTLTSQTGSVAVMENGGHRLEGIRFTQCQECRGVSIWLDNSLIYPASATAPAAHDSMPEDIRRDYDEARAICDLSPRGAAAFLRLAIQKLCRELGGKGKRIDDDIALLVSQGLDPLMQQALDIVRVIGNNSVHPGEIDLRDDRETAIALFSIVNEIVEALIARPARIKALYSELPQGDRDAIERRNVKALATQTPPSDSE